MRLPSPRFLIGLVLVLVACIGVAYVVSRSGAEEATGSPNSEPATITCIGGSEKTELMADPKVKSILHDRYGLTVTFQPLGSYDQVQLSTDELRARKTDCLWPSSASAQSVFEKSHSGAFGDYRAENLLQSPEVVYAGPKGTDALVKAGLVEQRDKRYYIVNVKNLLLDYVLKKRTWESIQAGDLRGPIAIASTDAAKSNSGFTLAQLQLNIIATADVFSAPSAEQARTALKTLRALYDAQGLQARSSDAGFRQWLTQGGEFHAPLYAGYENQFIQQVIAAGGNSAALLKNVRVLYPEPTIYSDHPLLALSPAAGRFIDAMKDTEIQTIAWKTYGFRSGTQIGFNNVTDFPDLPLADQFRTTTPPNADVTLMLLSCVKDAKTC
ncbi:hypothetical protein F4553_001316 [Allocatelliglobosispora scoriae]|uniref:ABC transporter substrate-binding protein n=1 Tax=Allocatelliglobosispora scoriae TaxID=643052 RepID=A0A841BFS3_9ACTN|nr:substrate-binding domain-containing protein [Allocatelliglobosispora scoriae]MBB5867937.1 hypothetical protein [Allocatelliglobosispora scoriae]